MHRVDWRQSLQHQLQSSQLLLESHQPSTSIGINHKVSWTMRENNIWIKQCQAEIINLFLCLDIFVKILKKTFTHKFSKNIFQKLHNNLFCCSKINKTIWLLTISIDTRRWSSSLWSSTQTSINIFCLLTKIQAKENKELNRFWTCVDEFRKVYKIFQRIFFNWTLNRLYKRT